MTPSPQTLLSKFHEEFNPPRWLLLSFLVVAIADTLTTFTGLYLLNGPYEKNLVPLLAIDLFGPLGLLLPYPLGFLIWCSLAYLHPWRPTAFRVLGIYYVLYSTYIVLGNISILLSYA